ncbi:MAG TPA: iron uptake porin [Synechococcales cyanobacterium M55_K2018_004]|nr:iron uptake porin [Synechococcales cyanobacterium M55_K2018_004]
MSQRIIRSLLLATPAVLGTALAGSMPAIANEVSPATNSGSPVTVPASNASVITLDAPALPVSQQLTGSVSAEPAPVTGTPAVSDPFFSQLNRYSQEGQGAATEAIGLVTSVNQLSDVRPTDWAYEALSRLIENYGCIAGYPDGTFRGNRALTRYEFAAGLNACLDALAERIGTGGVSEEDLQALRQLLDEFRTELAQIRGIVDNLEARVAELESNQFSTTTKLNGETIFAFSDAFGGDNISANDDNNFVFQSRTRLNFDTSFTGRDRLRARLQAGNFDRFTFSAGQEYRLGFDTSTTNNTIQLDTLSYRFPVGDQLTVHLIANGGGIDDIANTITPFDSSGRGAVSRFGQRNPIYRLAGTAGLGLSYQFTNPVLTRNILSIQAGYLGGEANNPAPGNGLFNGDYGAFVQLTGTRFLDERLNFAFYYVHTYNDTDLGTGTGTNGARLREGVPVVGNSYGASLNFSISPNFQIGGWFGYTFGRAIRTGDANIMNFAVTLAFPNLGGDGNLGGIIFGMQPTLVDADSAIGSDDPDPSFHLEGFYRLALTDNIDITPGVIWLFSPNGDSGNDDVIIGTIRTTFRF